MKLIIIEGTSESGKTLLAGNIMSKIDKETDGNAFIKYIHHNSSVENGISSFEEQFSSLFSEISGYAEDNEFDYIVVEESPIIEDLNKISETDLERIASAAKERQKKILNLVGNDNILYIFLYDSENSGLNENLLYKYKNFVSVDWNGGWKPEFRVLDEALEGFKL